MRLYRNFDLELYDHQAKAGGESFMVRVGRAPAGDQKHSEASAVELPPGLRASIQRLEGGAVDGAELIDLGERLGGMLLPPGTVRELFELSLAGLGENEGLRLRLRIEEPALAALPWEFAYLPLPGTPAGQRDQRGFLSLRPEISLTRYEPLPRPPKPFSPVGRPRLVCLTSNPTLPGSDRLDLAGEKEKIESALAELAVDSVFPATGTLEDLRRSLEGDAHLFHFGGHGMFSEGQLGDIPRTAEGEGYLLFEDRQGGGLAVPAEQVALNLIGHGVRVAVLNSCYSGRRDAIRAWTGVGPVLAHERLPAVLANQFRIEDRAAIEFARSFYDQLAAGVPIDAAVSAGRLAIFNLDPPAVSDWGSFVLYLRLDDDSDGVVFPQGVEERPTRRFWANLALVSACLVATIVVFSRQIEPRLPPSWPTFGGLGALGLAALVWGFLQFFAGEEIKSALRRAIASAAATAVSLALFTALSLTAWLVPLPSPILLLLPFGNVNQNLPRLGRAQGALCSLEAVGETGVFWTVPEVARQAIVVGATEERFHECLSREDLEQLLRRVLERLQVEDEQKDRWLHLWLESPRFEPSLGWGRGGPVTLRLVKRGEPEPLWQSARRELYDLEGTAVKVWEMEAEDGSKLSSCIP